MRQTQLRNILNHTVDEINDNLQRANRKFWEAHNNAIELNKVHILSLDQAHTRGKGATENMETTLRLRIER